MYSKRRGHKKRKGNERRRKIGGDETRIQAERRRKEA